MAAAAAVSTTRAAATNLKLLPQLCTRGQPLRTYCNEPVIVSGFYRSGTSVMMNILRNLEPIKLVCDEEEETTADINDEDSANPYFLDDRSFVCGDVTLEQIKLLSGCATKIMWYGLDDLKEKFDGELPPMKVIVMKRDLDCIKTSLERRDYFDKPVGHVDSWKQERTHAYYWELMKKQNFDYEVFADKWNGIVIDYDRLIDDTETIISELADYIGIEADAASISQIVNDKRRHHVTTTVE